VIRPAPLGLALVAALSACRCSEPRTPTDHAVTPVKTFQVPAKTAFAAIADDPAKKAALRSFQSKLASAFTRDQINAAWNAEAALAAHRDEIRKILRLGIEDGEFDAWFKEAVLRALEEVLR
jgi:hypothetical protein